MQLLGLNRYLVLEGKDYPAAIVFFHRTLCRCKASWLSICVNFNNVDGFPRVGFSIVRDVSRRPIPMSYFHPRWLCNSGS